MDRPGISKCSPKRAQSHQDVTKWFQRWCAANGVSRRELAAVLGVTVAVAAKKLSGESPVALVDVLAFPDRFRDRLLTSLSRELCGAGRDDLLAHG